MFTRVVLLFSLLVTMAAGFMTPMRQMRVTGVDKLKMSEVPGGDPLEAIKAKMAADPSYNPMSDPQAMQVLESMIPQEMKDLPNAVERLKVSFTDATTGQDAIEDLDQVASGFEGDKKSLLQSPSSSFFSGGMESPDGFDENEKANLFKKLREDYPDVPPPGSQ